MTKYAEKKLYFTLFSYPLLNGKTKNEPNKNLCAIKRILQDMGNFLCQGKPLKIKHGKTREKFLNWGGRSETSLEKGGGSRFDTLFPSSKSSQRPQGGGRGVKGG